MDSHVGMIGMIHPLTRWIIVRAWLGMRVFPLALVWRFVVLSQALMFSATMRLEDSAVGKARREEFVDSILTVSRRRA